MRPEFINRVDEIIAFNQLSEEDFGRIARIMLKELADVLTEKGIAFEADDSVIGYLVEKSFSVTYGARNLRRLIQKEIEDAVALLLINRYSEHITQIKASMDGEKLALLAL